MPKVSVIVPVYNTARYIERCARSLFEQTLDDIELIFIDDCSPDNSIDLLKAQIEKYRLRFAEKSKLVRIMRMPTNSGLAAVRRHGIIHATGDYIIHCDSDDWVDTDLYEKMYSKAIAANADIVVCGIRDEYKDRGITRSANQLPPRGKEIVENWYKNSIGMFAWNKLVKRSIYLEHNVLPFEGVNMWEDNGLMLRVFYYAKRLEQVYGPVYHYNQANANAMTSGYGRNAIDQMLKCASLVDEFFSSKPDAARFSKTVLTLKYLAKLNLVAKRYDWLKEYHRLFPESDVAMKWIRLNTFSKRGKVRFLFAKHHLEYLFVFMFKLKSCMFPL